ncbi:uncharacterized protein [Nicotiana sylvestris]|uniref:uncharacterized protein n=1 Tax=Nicotiana sylvestris TaxID=4096 RepID=UPI00388C5787
MKAQALADHLAENPIDDEYQPLSTYFPDEEINTIGVVSEDAHAWKMFFDGVVNAKAEYEACIMGMNMAIDQDVEDLLIMRDSDLIIQQAQGKWEIRDVKLIPYRQHVEDLSNRFKSIEFRYIPRCHNELADALATLASMLPYPGKPHIDPLEIQIRERHSYCNLYQQRMARAYNKKVRPRNFEVGQLVLRRILPHHQEAKGKFAPNWKGPYIIRKILPRGALYLGDIEGNDPETAVNANAVKRYYV